MNWIHLQCRMQKLPPLVELRAFDPAARHLSFKKAAAELGVTPLRSVTRSDRSSAIAGAPYFTRGRDP
jgi:hypothetical protein